MGPLLFGNHFSISAADAFLMVVLGLTGINGLISVSTKVIIEVTQNRLGISRRDRAVVTAERVMAEV